MSVDIWPEVSAAGTQWIEARDAAQHTALLSRAPSLPKNYLVQNVHSATVEKSWCKIAIGLRGKMSLLLGPP